MSVRKRAINNRLARTLNESQEALSELRVKLAERDKLIADLSQKLAAESTRNDALFQSSQQNGEDLKHLAALVARQFTTPPAVLSRDSELFAVVKRLTPHKVPPTPTEMIDTVLGTVGLNLNDVVGWANSAANVREDLTQTSR